MGNPINNQQCYRKISVTHQFVIGHKTAEPDDTGVNALPYGQAIFYAIYPRFTNVNIRLTTDIFTGEVDVYVTNENDEFTVEYNHTSGHHQVIVKSLARYGMFAILSDYLVLRAFLLVVVYDLLKDRRKDDVINFCCSK